MQRLATTLIIFTSFFLLAGVCSFSSRNQDPISAVGSSTYTYLALGDSYTIGEGVDATKAWPYQLAKSLTAEGVAVKSPKIIAKTGWRTDNLAAAIKEEELQAGYDLVSLQIGVNNQFQGKNIETYKKDLSSLINTAIGLCKSGKDGVFVLSIPDYGSTPFGKIDRVEIGKEIDEWNAACKRICNEFQVAFFDITPISKKGASDSALVAKDGLHPSAKMYSLWVDEILEGVQQLIK